MHDLKEAISTRLESFYPRRPNHVHLALQRKYNPVKNAQTLPSDQYLDRTGNHSYHKLGKTRVSVQTCDHWTESDDKDRYLFLHVARLRMRDAETEETRRPAPGSRTGNSRRKSSRRSEHIRFA